MDDANSLAANRYDPASPEARDCTGQPVGVHTLASSPTNPRKSFPEASMAELIKSVKQHGVFTPILVRCWPASYPWTGEMPLYEVVAGERRFRAAKAAGLRLIPALVRNLTDKQVIEIQLTENLQREDVHPLEEAEGYQRLMNEHGYTADVIAEKVNKSRSYIFGRLKLLALDDDSRSLFAGGVLNASTALLVARIPTPALRAKAIKEITEKNWDGDTKSVRQAQRWIRDRYMLKLADATFPIDDATLCNGACSDCAKRTGNAQEVFEDIDSPDVCTDPDCFQEKKSAFMMRSIASAKASGAQVITGKEASKIAPHGIHSYTTIKAFTQLDAKCYEDPEKRTYREILGDSVETVLVEDSVGQRLVPLVANTVLADHLKEVGIDSHAAKADKEEKKRKAKLDIERAYRDRLFSNLRAEVGNFTLAGVPTLLEENSTWILMRTAGQLFTRLYSDVQDKIVGLWHAEGKNVTERRKNFVEQTLPGLNSNDIWRLLVDLTTAGATLVSEYSLDHEPKALIEMAARFNIDHEEVRKTVVSEGKAPQKVGKPDKQANLDSKKAKKPSATASAGASPATEAARAGEGGGENDQFKVGDRVRVKDDSAITDPDASAAWKHKVCGRIGVVSEIYDSGVLVVDLEGDAEHEEFGASEVEPAPSTTEAARAAGTMRDEPCSTRKVKSKKPIENNEKTAVAKPPRPASDAGELRVGDHVRIKNGLRGMAGKLRKCCGREGVIEAMPGGYIHVRTAPGVNGLVTNLVWNEIDRLSPATNAAQAPDIKANRNSARVSPGERKPAKSKKVMNENTVRA